MSKLPRKSDSQSVKVTEGHSAGTRAAARRALAGSQESVTENSDGLTRYFVLHGSRKEGNTEENLARDLGVKSSMEWSIRNKKADPQPGDHALIYLFKNGEGAICAQARLASKPYESPWAKDRRNAQAVDLCDVRMLPRAVTHREILKAIPDWRYMLQPRADVCVPAHVLLRLLKLLHAGAKPDVPPEKTVAAKSETRSWVTDRGAGFGTDQAANEEVEDAAVEAVKRHYSRQGYGVESVETDNIGYDLVCTRQNQQLHVEVKGVRGSRPDFFLSRNELDCAGRDPRHLFCVVTTALSKPTIRVYPGHDLESCFEVEPSQYRARLKTTPRADRSA
jgi:hypothetical protein